jgi:thiamine biosynthesis lipoprotein
MPAPGALDTRAKVLLILFLCVLVGLSVHRLLFAPPVGPYVSFSGTTMGTTFDVKVASEQLGPDAQREVSAAIAATLDAVNAAMSTWDPSSELSRLNASDRVGEPFPVSAHTLEVLSAAAEIGRISGGAFDVTVGPLMDAWGFGSDSYQLRRPAPEELAALRAHVGQALLTLDQEAGTVSKGHRDVTIDVSAIAKGHGVDRIAEALEALGYRSYLVEIGGELRAAGRKLDGTPWRVAIERPESDARAIHQIVTLEDRALATSGDYRNFYLDGDERFSHAMDPRTGAPVRHRLASVSVLHPSAMYADAWATALNVLGPEAGYALAVRQGLPAYFIERGPEGRYTSRVTPGFAPLLSTPASE